MPAINHVVMVDNDEPGHGGRNEPSAATDAEPASAQRQPMTVATEVWIITTLLHREQPERQGFSTREILARARRERLCDALRPGFTVHVNQHCVANRPPNPARLRLLVETAPGRRRLFRPGGPYDPRRARGRTLPERAKLRKREGRQAASLWGPALPTTRFTMASGIPTAPAELSYLSSRLRIFA